MFTIIIIKVIVLFISNTLNVSIILKISFYINCISFIPKTMYVPIIHKHIKS